MTKSLRRSFSKEVVSSVHEDILTRRANYYYFLGGVEPWLTSSGDLDPNLPLDETALSNREIRRQIAFVKRVAPGDASLVVREIPWVQGKVFTEWDDRVDLVGEDFYIINSGFEVYKCLDNNYGSASQHCPVGASVEPISLPDGYIWKYLYTVPVAKRKKYIALGHIPVQRALSDSFYSNGSIGSVSINDGGSGYIDAQRTFVVLEAKTTGSGAVLEISGVNAAGTIAGVNVISGGSGYTKGAKIVFEGAGINASATPVTGKLVGVTIQNKGANYHQGDPVVISQPDNPLGVQAEASIVVVDGKIENVFIDNPGSGYNTQPTIAIISSTGLGALVTATVAADTIASVHVDSGGVGYDPTTTVSAVVGGASCVASVSRVTGSITNITVTDPGAGYTGEGLGVPKATAYVYSATGDGTGLYGNATAIVEPVIYDGKLQRVAIVDPGQSYPADNDTVIVVSGSGSGAVVSPVIYDERIIDVIIEEPGIGYTDVRLSVQSGTGTGAKLAANILTSDLRSDQSYVEQTAVDGAIHNIKVVSGGAVYSDNATVVIEGNGEGCTAEPVVEFGAITRINITSIGSGYTYASARIVDPGRSNPNGDIPDAALRPIISPAGGHGKDAVKELLCNTVSITASLRNEDLKLSRNNDFRLYGLIKNPLDLFSGGTYSASNSLLAYKVVVDRTDDLVFDELLWFGNNRYRVMDYVDNVLTLVPADKQTAVPLGELQSLDRTRSYYAFRMIGNQPTLDKYSGDLIFVSSDDPFSVTEEQNIVARTLLKLN